MLKSESLSKRIMLVGGLGLLLLLVFSFSNRIAEFTRLSAQEGVEAARITQLASTQSYLSEQIAYVTSEAAVEEWAREEARMAQQGDFPVVPLNPNGEGTEFAQDQPVADQQYSNFQVWLNWLFHAGP